MGKSESGDLKKAEKKARKRAKKEAKKEAKRVKKEQKRREKEEKKQDNEIQSQNEKAKASIIVNAPMNIPEESEAAIKDSVFYKKRIEVSLSLLPADMKNIKAALEDSVRSMILKYTDKVGVLMTFENIQVISNNGHGIILNELPFLHYRIAFDGLVFSPHVGCKLQGAVTESFPSHLGILVLGYFNAMIPAKRLTEAGYSFDGDLQEWAKEDGTSAFTTHNRVDFRVDRIHESVGTLSMEGSKPVLSPFQNPPSFSQTDA